MRTLFTTDSTDDTDGKRWTDRPRSFGFMAAMHGASVKGAPHEPQLGGAWPLGAPRTSQRLVPTRFMARAHDVHAKAACLESDSFCFTFMRAILSQVGVSCTLPGNQIGTRDHWIGG